MRVAGPQLCSSTQLSSCTRPGRLLQEGEERLAWADQQAAGLEEGEAMEERDGLRLLEGQGQAPLDGLSALDRLLWPLHRSLSKSPTLQEWVWKKNLRNTWLKCLLQLGLLWASPQFILWAVALQPVSLSLAHTQQSLALRCGSQEGSGFYRGHPCTASRAKASCVDRSGTSCWATAGPCPRSWLL